MLNVCRSVTPIAFIYRKEIAMHGKLNDAILFKISNPTHSVFFGAARWPVVAKRMIP